MVPGFVLASLGIVVVSLLDKVPSPTIQHAFAQMEREMAGEDSAVISQPQETLS